MVYFVRLAKSGNSVVIAIPAPVREALHLGHGDKLAVTIEHDRMIAVKMTDVRASRLTEALRTQPPLTRKT